MKKSISLILTVISVLCIFSACTTQKGTDKKLTVVTTIFPIYDWTMNILGDNAENTDVTMLLSNGVDLHSFQPSASDIMKLSSCDIFIYIGGESDSWADDALKEAVNQDMIVVNLLDALGNSVKEEEIVEGMEAEKNEAEIDEHIWLSLKNAAMLVNVIKDALSKADPNNKTTYEANAENYVKKLAELDKKYQSVVDNSAKKALLFGDRFPFRYLTDDYGIEYYAAFSGCSAESEASFKTITFLAQKLSELSLNAILKTESSDAKIAEAIASAANNKSVKILSMDSMQSITFDDVKNGENYIGIMEKNLGVLKDALEVTT